MKISRRAALSLLGVPALAGCSGPIDFTPEEFRSSAPVDDGIPPELVVEPGFFARSTQGRHVDVPGSTSSGLVFATPHLDGRLGEITVSRTIPYDVAQRVDQTAPLRAPEGYRFVAFSAQAGRPVFPESAEHPVTVALNQDGTSRPLRNMFGGLSRGRYQVAWEFMVACIPADGSLVLEVSDEGKTIRIDLVEGAPAVDEAWHANEGFRERQTVAFDPPDGVFQRAFVAQPAGHEAAHGRFRMGLRPSKAFMAPWNPEHQWAPPATQWLTIPMGARVEFQDLPADIELDLPSSFTYTAADGTKAELVTPRTITTETVRRQQSDVQPTFRVSGRDDRASLVFNVAGRIRVDFDNVSNVTGTFTGAARPLQFRLTFRDGEDRFGS
ncbi:hypothetical protein [uncultured Tessaracoccus sp.]|uniref:hypothetical protein n=1 Tax=uncultured Tessaracoccus sp. TaxID=905023 RepID=UPI0025D6A672|nr:hypothetical protein [uncultured Tessaracoccus sp.]